MEDINEYLNDCLYMWNHRVRRSQLDESGVPMSTVKLRFIPERDIKNILWGVANQISRLIEESGPIFDGDDAFDSLPEGATVADLRSTILRELEQLGLASREKSDSAQQQKKSRKSKWWWPFQKKVIPRENK